MEYDKVLKEIKSKLSNQALSALVGAGFSKNFDPSIFPSWWELITDMVKEYSEGSIKQEYDQLNANTGKLEYSEFLKLRIDQYIQDVGPLQAVSRYIKFKGYREIVDVRIEEGTPRIFIQDGKRKIKYKKNGEVLNREISQQEMLIHEKFVGLPWNNVYTTNYDNLLEESVDLKIKNDINDRIEGLKSELETTIFEIENKEGLLIQYNNNEYRASKEITKDIFTSNSNTAQSTESPSEVITVQQNVFKLSYEIEILKSKKNRLSEKLEKLQILKDDFSSLVIHSSQLAIKRTGNIIKIHGSLREDHEEYGFDGDAQKHYVISQEDFDSYPIKHEAFTQLMRISLLQESFCLFGFSGNDPNFLAWISWVRDIVQRKSNRDGKQYKIYLIDINENPPPLEKTLFYDNHKIAFIPLKHKKCIEFLENETGKKLAANSGTKDVISLFLQYLTLDTRPNRFKVAYELNKQDDYLNLISQISFLHKDEDLPKFIDFINKADELISSKQFCRIPIIELDAGYYGKHHILSAINKYWNEIILKTARDSFLKSVLCLIEDQLLPISILFYEEMVLFEKFLTLSQESSLASLSSRFLLLKLKDAVWQNDLKAFDSIFIMLQSSDDIFIKNEIVYQQILLNCYNLNFDIAYETLLSWEPDVVWNTRKASLIAYFDTSKAFDILNGTSQNLLQEELYQNQLLAVLEVFHNSTNKHNYRQKAKILEDSGLQSIYQNIDYFINRINRNDQKILPYGHNKFKITQSTEFSVSTELLDSIRLFNLLLEAGFPIALRGYNIIKPADINESFKQTFEYFPHQILFFLSQCNDEKFISKIAQDYIYSNKNIDKELQEISDNIQRAYNTKHINSRIKTNLLLFYSELINVLDPSSWEDFFYKVWQEEVNNLSYLKSSIRDHPFIQNSLRYITNVFIAAQIINTCLSKIVAEANVNTRNFVIQILYELAQNLFLRSLFKKQQAQIDQQILNAIIRDVSKDINMLFILGNIDPLLSDKQREEILKGILDNEDLSNANERVWRIILLYKNDSTQLLTKIRKSILENSRLWYNGIQNNTVSSDSSRYISLYRLRKNRYYDGIIWSKEEAVVLFNRLVQSLTEIRNTLNKLDDALINYKSILEEMIWFLEYEKNKLIDIETYENITTQVTELYINQKGFNLALNGLISTERNNVLWALSEVSYRLHNYNEFEDYSDCINIVINKLLLKSEPAISECLGTISDWVFDFRNEDHFRTYKSDLEKIIVVYKTEPPANQEVPFLQEKLIKIALVLDIWGTTVKEVHETLLILSSSKYNVIKYTLRAFLDNENDS
jgi:hypothetical protein